MGKQKSLTTLVKQAGIGLLELMLSLAIIAVLLVMATRYYESAQLGEQVNNFVGIVQAMRAAAAQYSAGQGNYGTLTFQTLVNAGLVPQSLAVNNGNGVGPWGDNLSVTGAGGTLTVQLGNSAVSNGGCILIDQRMTNYATSVSCTPGNGGNGGSITVQFS